MRPEVYEYAPYYETYVSQAPKGDNLEELLTNQLDELVTFFRSIPEEKGEFRYAEGKWTIKEVLLHIIDTERVMAYRALRFSRKDETPLPGFDQDDYVPFSDATNRTMDNLIIEWEAVRMASIALFAYMPKDMLERMGTASRNPFSVRALAYIILGHIVHHCNVLNERYL